MEKISIVLARLERIKTFIENWKRKGIVSNIERSIVLGQLSCLYDDLLDLDISKGNITYDDEAIKTEEKEEITPPVSSAAEFVVDEKEKKAETVVQTPVATETKLTVDSSQNIVQKEVKQEEQTKPVRLGDKYVGIHKYLFENFEGQDDTSAARFSSVDDINRAIGINDRFLFIKELFNGDKDLFTKTISTLNSCDSIDDALMYIHENFKWNSEDTAVKQLILLLYRRFK